jgi:tRNA wybutosine-synthesizing protein 3
MELFAEKMNAGKIDSNILEILQIINSYDDFYTSSSCSGRIQLISLPKFGDKVGSEVLGKWHDPVDFRELDEAIKKWDGKNFLMMLVQSPVVHVVCRSLEAAVKLRNIADASGFKYSTIRSIQTNSTKDEEQMNIIVEILSTERMDIPLGQNGKLYPTEEYMQFNLKLAIQCMMRSKGKLERLRNNLKEQL